VIEAHITSNPQVIVRFEVELIAGRVSERHGIAGLRPHATSRVNIVVGNSRQVTEPIVTVNKFANVLTAECFGNVPRPAEKCLSVSRFSDGSKIRRRSRSVTTANKNSLDSRCGIILTPARERLPLHVAQP